MAQKYIPYVSCQALKKFTLDVLYNPGDDCDLPLESAKAAHAKGLVKYNGDTLDDATYDQEDSVEIGKRKHDEIESRKSNLVIVPRLPAHMIDQILENKEKAEREGAPPASDVCNGTDFDQF